jgi:hypothetical protein
MNASQTIVYSLAIIDIECAVRKPKRISELLNAVSASSS